MATVLLLGCPDDYRAALPANALVRFSSDTENPPATDEPVDLVVIGPHSKQPTVVAQRAARAYPGVDVLIATPDSETRRVNELLRITPFIPLRTALVSSDRDEVLRRALCNAIIRCDFRRGHKQVLDSVQKTLAAAPSSDPSLLPPSDQERAQQRLLRFYELYERFRDEVADEVAEATQGLAAPGFPLKGESAEETLSAARRERAAVLDGDWDAYLTEVAELGRRHAELGLPFSEWIEVAHQFRHAVLERLPNYVEGDSLVMRDVLLGMEFFVGKTFKHIARAYSASHLALVRRHETNAELFASAVDASLDAIFTTGVDGTITAHNPAAARLTGRSVALGSNILDWAQGDHQDELRNGLQQAAKGTAARAVETTWNHRDGHAVQVSVSISPVWGPGAAPVGLSIIAQDITERKYAEDSLRQAHKMEAVGRLAGGIAHDFNNLLTIILGHASLLRQAGHDSVDFADDVGEIVEAADRARSLTSQLLAFSRSQPLNPSAIDLGAAVASTEKLLRRTLPAGIELVVHPATDLWRVFIDRGHVDQLMMNLALNARDAMPTGGTLGVELHNEVVTKASGTLRAGEYVVICVTDTGLGIPANVIDRIFDPFFTTKGVGTGTGIGLATCYSIVRQARGDIRVWSEPGQGTRFTVWLPRVEGSSPPKSEVTQTKPTGLQGSETVLVVEDEPSVLATTTRTLRHYGYGVLQADNGEAALSVLAHHSNQVDLIVTDIVMPRMTGPELAEVVRKEYPSMPLMFMTGYANEESMRHEALGGGARILLKPFLPTEFVATVREVLDESVSRDEMP